MELKCTARDMIRNSMRRLNIISYNEEPEAEDFRDCLLLLNELVDTANNELHMFSYRQEININLNGNSVYDITERPVQGLESVLFKNPNENRYIQLTELNREGFYKLNKDNDFNKENNPNFFFYNGIFPISQINIFPAPLAGELKIIISGKFELFEKIDDIIYLPSGYQRYLSNALTVMAAPLYGKVADDVIVGKAVFDKALIKESNKKQNPEFIKGDFPNCFR